MAKANLVVASRVNVTVAPAATETLDTVPVAKFKGLRYFVSGSNKTNDLTKVLDLTVRKDNADTEDVVFGKLGPMPLQISTSQVGGAIIVEITNPNAYEIAVEALRFALK